MMNLMEKSKRHKNSHDVFKDFTNPEAISAEIIEKWMHLAYRLYEKMLDASEYSFFLSTPQFISQLSFLMAICREKMTGLRSEFGWNPTSGELAHQVQHQNLLENTETFMRRWRCELRGVSKPGRIQSARRALCYPKNAVAFHLNTLECLRSYHVELKVFETPREHRNWVHDHLEGNFDKTTVVNVWDQVSSEQSSAKKKAGDEEEDVEKKTPILVWVSSASVAILPEVFDARQLYTHRNVDYFRVVATPKVEISVVKGENPWTMTIIPTVNARLNFILIYDFSRNLCPFDDLRLTIEKHRTMAPCVIRHFKQTKLEQTDKKAIYFPVWHEDDFHPNRYAEVLKETVDVEELFTKGGFGDLACASSIPSPGGAMNKISHLQHFSILSFFNTPSTRKPTFDDDGEELPTERHNFDAGNKDLEIVPYPFCALLWDSERHIPVFMGKITGKSLVTNAVPEKKGLRRLFYLQHIYNTPLVKFLLSDAHAQFERQSQFPSRLVQKWIENDCQIGQKLEVMGSKKNVHDFFLEQFENRIIYKTDEKVRILTDKDDKHIFLKGNFGKSEPLTRVIVPFDLNDDDLLCQMADHVVLD